MKNQESKSVILAPFNSTKSNLEELERNYTLPAEIKAMIQSKSCLKFAHRVQEIDKQYEVNNNAELDNGVYHDFNVQEEKVGKEDSLHSDCKQVVTSNDQLQKLENMILK